MQTRSSGCEIFRRIFQRYIHECEYEAAIQTQRESNLQNLTRETRESSRWRAFARAHERGNNFTTAYRTYDDVVCESRLKFQRSVLEILRRYYESAIQYGYYIISDYISELNVCNNRRNFNCTPHRRHEHNGFITYKQPLYEKCKTRN